VQDVSLLTRKMRPETVQQSTINELCWRRLILNMEWH